MCKIILKHFINEETRSGNRQVTTQGSLSGKQFLYLHLSHLFEVFACHITKESSNARKGKRLMSGIL